MDGNVTTGGVVDTGSTLPTPAPTYGVVGVGNGSASYNSGDYGTSDDLTSVSYQSIDNGDIQFESIESLTFTSDYFNPGYKNRLQSSVNINLDTEEKRNLFEAWLYGSYGGGSSVNVNLTISWEARDVTNISSSDDDGILVGYSDDTNDLEYDFGVYEIESTTSAVYSIESSYALYSDNTASSKYSGISFCSVCFCFHCCLCLALNVLIPLNVRARCLDDCYFVLF